MSAIISKPIVQFIYDESIIKQMKVSELPIIPTVGHIWSLPCRELSVNRWYIIQEIRITTHNIIYIIVKKSY